MFKLIKNFFTSTDKPDRGFFVPNNISVQEVPAEVIHAEVDEVEDKFLEFINTLINNNEGAKELITIKSHEDKKAELLKKLNFNNSELVVSTNERKEAIKSLENTNNKLNGTLSLFQEYKKTYPFEKIMPFKEFEKVLDKFNLIYAPNTSYIKDVPEKNLLEILNAKKILRGHEMKPYYYVSNIKADFYRSFLTRGEEDSINRVIHKFAKSLQGDSKLRFLSTISTIKVKEYDYTILKDKSKPAYNVVTLDTFDHFDNIVHRYINQEDLKSIYENSPSGNNTVTVNFMEAYSKTGRYNRFRGGAVYNHEIQKLNNEHPNGCLIINVKIVDRVVADKEAHKEKLHKLYRKINGTDQYWNNIEYDYSELSRKGLFIAAPKSHFDMSKLTQATERGYYEGVNEIKVDINTKDPIAFEFLQGDETYPDGFVRIISKWGTDDDQSYLDPSVQNEILN